MSCTAFLLYYDWFMRVTLLRLPEANLYVFVANIAIGADNHAELLDTLSHVNDVAYHMGVKLTADKTKIHQWDQHWDPSTLTWQGQDIPIKPPLLTYLGHLPDHLSHEDTAWDMATTQFHWDLANYKTPPLNYHHKAAVVNVLLISLWAYPGYSWATDKERPNGTISSSNTSRTPQGWRKQCIDTAYQQTYREEAANYGGPLLRPNDVHRVGQRNQ